MCIHNEKNYYLLKSIYYQYFKITLDKCMDESVHIEFHTLPIRMKIQLVGIKLMNIYTMVQKIGN